MTARAKGICLVPIVLLALLVGVYAETWSEDFVLTNPPEEFSWELCGQGVFWYLDGGEMKVQLIRTFEALSNLQAGHVKTRELSEIAHYHVRYDFGEGGTVDPDKVDDYWDARFPGCTKEGGPDSNFNCHAWAFGSYACGPPDWGAYNYAFRDPTKAYDDDVEVVESPDTPAVHDLLRYGTAHTSVIHGVDGAGVPTALKWKFQTSSTYIYSVTSGHEYDTPMCVGSDEVDKTPEEKGWQWTVDGAGPDGTPYHWTAAP